MIEYRDVVGNAHLKFYWESAGAGVPYEIVPTGNMFYAEDISGSPYNYTVVAGEPNGPKSTARGKGLYKATAGLDNHFVLESRDAFGNWRGDFDNGFGAEKAFYDRLLEDIAKMDGFIGSATLVTDNSGGGYGTTKVPVSIVFNSTTKLFDCTYVPGKAGVYDLHVGLSAEYHNFMETPSSLPQIFGSPFTDFRPVFRCLGGLWKLRSGRIKPGHLRYQRVLLGLMGQLGFLRFVLGSEPRPGRCGADLLHQVPGPREE